MSVTHVVRDAYDMVLPDNAEETGEEHCRIAWAPRLPDATFSQEFRELFL